jgi:phosphate:Na+ symporter
MISRARAGARTRCKVSIRTRRNLEHIGDIIDKNLCELALKKIKRGYQFSPEGTAELTEFHKRTLESLQAAFGIFMMSDVEAARKLLRTRTELRKAELDAADRHFERLREGRPESLETTSLHLDILSDLKRIHSHICSVAYPVLEAAGELNRERLSSALSAAGNSASNFQSLPPRNR